MALYFFTIPVAQSKTAETALNTFISQNKVLNIEKYFVADGANSFWSVCVTSVSSQQPFSPSTAQGKRPKIDYKEILSPEDFTIFAKLRELRKNLSNADGVPAYSVFNNEQLSKLVTNKVKTLADILAIEGVGQARVDKYGAAFLKCLQQNRQ